MPLVAPTNAGPNGEGKKMVFDRWRRELGKACSYRKNVKVNCNPVYGE